MANSVINLVDPDAEWNLQPHYFEHAVSWKTGTLFHITVNSMFAQTMLAGLPESQQAKSVALIGCAMRKLVGSNLQARWLNSSDVT